MVCDHRRMRVHRTLLAMSVAGAVAGCAGPGVLPGHGGGDAARATTPFQRGVAVIRAWSTALRTGHVKTAATYFQVPVVFYNGPEEELVLHTEKQVLTVNRLFPCGAVYVSAERKAHSINALFRLTDRPGPGGGPNGCGDGVGTTARVNFVISDGKITHWLRAPSQPGDGRRAHVPHGTSPSTGTSPGTNTVPAKPPGSKTTPSKSETTASKKV
jgi:hypothetical protein